MCVEGRVDLAPNSGPTNTMVWVSGSEIQLTQTLTPTYLPTNLPTYRQLHSQAAHKEKKSNIHEQPGIADEFSDRMKG